PFVAANTTATLKKILDGTYDDPRSLSPALSDELSEIIAKCLARDPAARFSDAVQLRDTLAAYLGTLGLTHVAEEVADFFSSPDAYRARLLPRLVTRLLEAAEILLGEKRTAKALSVLNQVLALEPNQPQALALVAQLNLARQRERSA